MFEKSRPVACVAALLALLPACAIRPAVSPSAAVDARQADELELEVGFICPMHPDHTSHEPGRCPRCGMALVQGTLFDMRNYRLDFETVPAVPKPGEPLRLLLTVRHPDTGEPVRRFERVHDKAYHLFVISQDMEFFQHIHPEQDGDGRWSIDVVLPRAGYYAVLSDFMPSGGSAQFLTRPLVTAGVRDDLLAAGARLVRDPVRTQTVDDLTATVTFDPDVFSAGTYGHVTFHLTRAGTNQPVTELQTYLGAFGHMLIMSEDMVDYVHSHPEDIPSPELDLETLTGGPRVMFEGLMPKPGRYRAWTQFRYRDRVYTFTNTFEVAAIGAPQASRR